MRVEGGCEAGKIEEGEYEGEGVGARAWLKFNHFALQDLKTGEKIMLGQEWDERIKMRSAYP